MPAGVKVPGPALVTVIVCGALTDPMTVDGKADGPPRVTTGSGTATAVPDSGMLCGLPTALSVTVTAALRAPTTVGVNRTLRGQDAPAASVDPHPVASRTKSATFVPVTVIPETDSVPVPVLVRVSPAAAPVVPMTVSANAPEPVRAAAACSAGPPVPLTLTLCGLPRASSVTVRVANLNPVVTGVKVMRRSQLDPAATVAPHPVLSNVNEVAPVPVIATLLMVSTPRPVLATVTVRAADAVPIGAVPKVTEPPSETDGNRRGVTGSESAEKAPVPSGLAAATCSW